MNTKKIVLIVLISISAFSCSQNRIVELPLTVQNGYGPFNMEFQGFFPYEENENNPWKNTYLKISKFPEGLTDMKYGHIETNIYQSVYQDYLLGNITKDFYEVIQKQWNWAPDTLILSKIPMKTKIAFAYGKDAEGVLKIAVDVNNNLDLSDDKLFTPPLYNFIIRLLDDTIIRSYAVDIAIETLVDNKIAPISVPLIICSESDRFMCSFPQYFTTKFKGKKIAVSSGFMNLTYKNIRLALTDNLKNGEKIKKEDTYIKNEYIGVEDEVYKILGTNTSRKTLVLEKTDLPKTLIFSTQVGFKAYPFQTEEFSTKTEITLERFRGKYILLDFWAEWCGPCIAEFPNLKELYSKTDRAKFEIIGIAGRSSFNGIKRLIEQHEIPWPQILSDEIVDMYGINSFPSKIILDTEGKVVAKDLGLKLEEKILELLKE